VRNKSFIPKEDEHEILKKYRKERQENSWENASLMRISKDGSQAQNPILLCQKPKDTQIAHLNGPFTFTLRSGERQSLKRGAEDNLFDVQIGTPGLSTRNSRYPVFAPLTTSEVPADVHAIAKFEFPLRTSQPSRLK
jgi:hypothetical protein